MLFVKSIRNHYKNLEYIVGYEQFLFKGCHIVLTLSDDSVVLLESLDDVRSLTKRVYGVTLFDNLFAVVCYDKVSMKVAQDISDIKKIGVIKQLAVNWVECFKDGVAIIKWGTYSAYNLVDFIKLVNGGDLYTQSYICHFEDDSFWFSVRNDICAVELGSIAKSYFTKYAMLGE